MPNPVALAEASESVKNLTNDEIKNRIKMLENNMKQFKLENGKIKHDLQKVNDELKDNKAKIKQNKQLPWLVSNIVEILDMPAEINDDGTIDTEEKPEEKCVVVKTSTRNTVFLPVPGLVDVPFFSLSPQTSSLESSWASTRIPTSCLRNCPMSTTAESAPWKSTRSPPKSTLTSEGSISKSRS